MIASTSDKLSVALSEFLSSRKKPVMDRVRELATTNNNRGGGGFVSYDELMTLLTQEYDLRFRQRWKKNKKKHHHEEEEEKEANK